MLRFEDFRTADFWVRNMAGFNPVTVLVKNPYGRYDEVTFQRNHIHCTPHKEVR